MLLIAPIDDLSIGKKKGRVNDSDGRKLLRSVRKMKSAVGGLTSQNAKSFYTKSVGIEHRRAVVKARIVKHGKGWDEIRAKHIDYIQRGGVADDGGKGILFSATSDDADGASYLENAKNDEHEFRFIIAPESSAEIDLKWLTREVIKQMERDLDTKLQWVASDHYNTDNPHIHIVMRGVKEDGSKLTIASDYISNGIRNRTREILTRELGLRSAREIEVEYRNDIKADRFTSIDRFIKNHVKEAMRSDGSVFEFKTMEAATDLNAHMRVDMLKDRLEFLRESGLAEQTGKHSWIVAADWEKILRDNGIRNDIIKTMHKEAKLNKSDCEVYSRTKGNEISGTIVWRGIHEEMTDKQFIVVRDSAMKNHYVVLEKNSLPAGTKVGDKVVVSMAAREDRNRMADAGIDGFAKANDGVYDSKRYRVFLTENRPELTKEKIADFIKWNRERMESLSKQSVVFPDGNGLGDGRWKIPENYMSTVAALHAEKEGKTKYLHIGPLSDPTKDITANRFTSVDRVLKNNCDIDGVVNLKSKSINLGKSLGLDVLQERLKWLEERRLAEKVGPDSWKIASKCEKTLRDNESTAAILGKMSKEMRFEKGQCEVYSRDKGNELVGSVVKRGIHDERVNREFIVVRDSQEKNHYVVLDRFSLPEGIKLGDRVTINTNKTENYLRKGDQVIERFAKENGNIYDSVKYKNSLRASDPNATEQRISQYLKWNEDRLKELAKLGIVKAGKHDGSWEIPTTFLSEIYKVAKEKGGRQFLRIECERLAKQVKNTPNRTAQSQDSADRKPKKGRGI